MRFDWDPRKARLNQSKHRLAFEEAIRAFDDPFALVAPDEKHSLREKRQWLIGATEHGRIVVVVFATRGDIIRLISARPANRRERRVYEAFKNISL